MRCRIILGVIIVGSILFCVPPLAEAKRGSDDDDGDRNSVRSSSSSSSASSASSSSSTSSGSSGSSAKGDGHSGEGKRKKKHFRAALIKADQVETLANGRAEFRAKPNGEKRLTVRVRVPVGSTTPPLPMFEAADSLQLYAALYRNEELFFRCLLEADDGRKTGTFAEFKAEIRSRARKGLRVKRGTCEIHGNALPIPLKGDRVIVTDIHGPLLEGKL